MGKFSDTLKSFDIFGASSTLNYKGQDSYKTSLGAVFSILVQTFAIVFGFIAVNNVLEYGDP